MWWRSLLGISLVMITIAAFLLLRQERQDRPSPAFGASRTDVITLTSLHAGGTPAVDVPGAEQNTHEEMTAFDVSEGNRLYHWYNCVACHANGGGDIGPPLMDDKWLYGAAPRNIYASILEGRPNGMPSFRGKLTEAQTWQLVAYVRSMSGHVPSPNRSSRNDDIQATPPSTLAMPEPIPPAGNPVQP